MDFLPKQLGKIRSSLQTFVNELPERSAALGVAPEEETAVLAALNAALGAMDAVRARKNDYKAALTARDTLLALALGLYRPLVNRIKTNLTYTEADGAILSIGPRRRRIDPHTLKPHFSIKVELNNVRLRIRRRGATSAGIRARRLGQTQWTDLGRAARATVVRPISPLAPDGPEVWEFCVVPYLQDKQVGLCSDIKTAVLGAERVAKPVPKTAA